MQREKGWNAPKSGVGFPHGKDKKKARSERAAEREKARLARLAPKRGA